MQVTHETLAFAIGYYYGRAVGNDEIREKVMEQFPVDVREAAKQAFNDGYESGVSDYVINDSPEMTAYNKDSFTRYERLIAKHNLYGIAFFGWRATKEQRKLINKLWKQAINDVPR